MITPRTSGLSTAALILLGLVLGSGSAAVLWLRPVEGPPVNPLDMTSTPIITPAAGGLPGWPAHHIACTNPMPGG